MFRAERRGTPGTALASEPSVTPRTSSRFDAGSVLTSSARRPRSASATAEAHARDVFPTPPLPVKNRKREGLFRKALKQSPRFGRDSVLVVLAVIVKTLPANRTPHRRAERLR